MNVAIDYDDTYTLNPILWNQIIEIFMKQNNNVYCVTKRYEDNAEDISAITNVNANNSDLSLTATVTKVSKRKKSSKKKIMIFKEIENDQKD